MRRGKYLIPGLLFALVSLPCLTYASPPDPTWLVGFYDDADYDDVVVSISSLVGVLIPDSPRVCLPVLTCLSRHIELRRPTSGAPLTVRERGPPRSLSSALV